MMLFKQRRTLGNGLKGLRKNNNDGDEQGRPELPTHLSKNQKERRNHHINNTTKKAEFYSQGSCDSSPRQPTSPDSQITMALINQLARKSDFKVEIPAFKGQQDPDVFIDWVNRVDQIFQFKRTSLERRLDAVVP